MSRHFPARASSAVVERVDSSHYVFRNTTSTSDDQQLQRIKQASYK